MLSPNKSVDNGGIMSIAVQPCPSGMVLRQSCLLSLHNIEHSAASTLSACPRGVATSLFSPFPAGLYAVICIPVCRDKYQLFGVGLLNCSLLRDFWTNLLDFLHVFFLYPSLYYNINKVWFWRGRPRASIVAGGAALSWLARSSGSKVGNSCMEGHVSVDIHLPSNHCLHVIIEETGLTHRHWAKGARKAGVRATEEADMVKSLLAKIGFRWSLGKMSADALRPCARVCIKARIAGASRSWRSWKESDPGSLSTPTNPPSNESITNVVSKPLLAISSESTRYLSGMLARHGDLERWDLSGIRSISSWERCRVAVGIAKWARGTPFAKRSFPGLINFPALVSHGKYARLKVILEEKFPFC